MRPSNQNDGTVEFGYVVQENSCRHRFCFEHPIATKPENIVLVPFPLFATKRCLGIDLELVHVNVTSQNLHRWLGNPRMRTKPQKNVVIHVTTIHRAHQVTVSLEHAPRLIVLEYPTSFSLQ